MAVEFIDLNEKAVFSREFVPRILRARPDYKVPLICMEPGQEIPAHPSGTGIFYFISGKGVMTVGGTEIEVKAGNMVFVEKGESRGIKATERLTAFAVHMG
ncbi:MAG: cupin domain-containing protein [Deltaproteobacteria bacterium]|nr:cupin domain-containing protein [Deltaproteobacteria bacterium]